MKSVLLYRFLLILFFAAVMPGVSRAATVNTDDFNLSAPVFAVDTVPSKKPVSKPEKKPDDKPEIKEVPKSKRQIKPKAIGERINVKPPVKVKPNIIKKPVKNIKRTIGKIG